MFEYAYERSSPGPPSRKNSGYLYQSYQPDPHLGQQPLNRQTEEWEENSRRSGHYEVAAVEAQQEQYNTWEEQGTFKMQRRRSQYGYLARQRPKTRNSNMLSAILCLLKEIDGPSLEVVEMAARCRMEELED